MTKHKVSVGGESQVVDSWPLARATILNRIEQLLAGRHPDDVAEALCLINIMTLPDQAGDWSIVVEGVTVSVTEL